VLDDVNITDTTLTGFGSSLGLDCGPLFTLKYSLFVTQTGKACIWFFGLPATGVHLTNLGFAGLTIPASSLNAALYSFSNLAIANSFFVSISGPFFHGDLAILTLSNCQLGASVNPTSVTGDWTTTDLTIISCEWKVADFTGSTCLTLSPTPTASQSPSPTISVSPVATPVQTLSVSPEPTVSHSPSPTESEYRPSNVATGSAHASQSPTGSATPARSPRPTATPYPTMTPTATPPFNLIMGASMGGAFVVTVVVFVVVFVCREMSAVSSEESIGKYRMFKNSDEGEVSDASESDPLNIHGSSSGSSD
jgi:hypothetical protein